jgi:ABC-type transport system substrate-binding protein
MIAAAVRSLRVPHITVLVALLALASACTATASATPTASATATATAAGAGADETPSAEATGGGAVNPGTGDPWDAEAGQHRGQDGEQFDYECPPNGEPRTVWGTDIYTDDSSVCTAAVHVGVITLEDGGDVTIEIRPGEDSYDGSERNGITTLDYPSWGGSFEIVDPDD